MPFLTNVSPIFPLPLFQEIGLTFTALYACTKGIKRLDVTWQPASLWNMDTYSVLLSPLTPSPFPLAAFNYRYRDNPVVEH